MSESTDAPGLYIWRNAQIGRNGRERYDVLIVAPSLLAARRAAKAHLGSRLDPEAFGADPETYTAGSVPLLACEIVIAGQGE